MLVECENCGAPLHVEPNTAFVTCRYCSHSNKVAGTRTLMAMTPADWQPPEEWDAEQRRAAKGAVVGVLASVVVVIALVVVGVGVGVVFFFNNSPFGGSAIPTVPGISAAAPTWNGTTPFTCGGNDDVRIDGVVANLPNDVAITVRSNCRVEIVNSQIVSRVGIDAQGNRDVRVSGSLIQASETGIRLSGNKQLDLSNTTVMAEETAIRATDNAHVTTHGGQVVGAPAVDTHRNARFNQNGTQVVDWNALQNLTGGLPDK